MNANLVRIKASTTEAVQDIVRLHLKPVQGSALATLTARVSFIRPGQQNVKKKLRLFLKGWIILRCTADVLIFVTHINLANDMKQNQELNSHNVNRNLRNIILDAITTTFASLKYLEFNCHQRLEQVIQIYLSKKFCIPSFSLVLRNCKNNPILRKDYLTMPHVYSIYMMLLPDHAARVVHIHDARQGYQSRVAHVVA